MFGISHAIERFGDQFSNENIDKLMRMYSLALLGSSLFFAGGPPLLLAQSGSESEPLYPPVDEAAAEVAEIPDVQPVTSDDAASGDVAGEVEELTSFAGEDPNFILPNQPVESIMGFSKTPLETPRSVSVISSELISNLSLNDVSDLTKVAPNTFTTTRWGVQGNIDIRNQVADTFFRGMKRIEPQGNSRTVLGANDQIEIVRGPPAPYLSPGKIGGYSNLSPKSGRSRQGQYLTKPTGFIQGTVGEYGRREMSAGYGGPMSINDRKGGFYLYGLVDDSETYYQNIPANQHIFQGAVTQEISENWRVETGMNYQESRTAGGFRNRLNQDFVNGGAYWGGAPLVDLDLDGSGKISQYEMEVGSPTMSGSLSTANRPLHQRWDSRYQAALNGTSPNVDFNNPPPNSALEAIMATSLAPYIDQKTANLLALMPKGFVLDPDTVRQTQPDYSAVALEKELRANLGLVYLDFINDVNPDLTYKNQLFFDSQDQFKDSELPFYQKQDVYVVEEKFTLQKKFSDTPDWLDAAAIISPNMRYTWAQRRSNTGDYDDRPDLSRPQNSRTPDDLFITPREDASFYTGSPYIRNRRSTYTELGVGGLIDLTFFEKANLLAGGRVDYLTGETTDKAGTLAVNRGQVGNPAGRYAARDTVADGDDIGGSYSFSLSYDLPFNLRPYVTYAEQSVLFSGSDHTIDRPTMAAGAFESSELTEAGIKGTFLENKLFATLAFYEQALSNISDDVGGSIVNSTRGRGVEMELKWAPTKNYYASLFGVVQKTFFDPGDGAWVRVHGEALGFQDIVDGSGNVIYPAEAFTWGGRAEVQVQDGTLTEHPAYPNNQAGFNTGYTFPFGLGVNLGATYSSAVQSGRYQQIILPSYIVFDGGLSYEFQGWRARFNVFNLTDELYFVGRSGATSGDVLFSVMPPRRMQFTLSKAF